MSWSVYSSEKYPKWDVDNNCQCDYLQALGVQVIFPGKTWVILEDFYRHVRYESWIDAAGEGRESIVTGKQLAERLVGDFGSRGLCMADLDNTSTDKKKEMEQLAEERNMKFRRLFVDRFEQQFRTKMQGGPGRWIPNSYEAECYKLLGLKPPDTVQKEQVQTASQVIIQQPDPEMIQQLVAQEVARQNESRLKR